MKTGIFEHEGELDVIGEADPLLMANSRELRFHAQQELWPVASIREILVLAEIEAATFTLLIRNGDIQSEANGEAVEPVVAICWGLRHGKQAAAMYQPYLSQANSARLQAMSATSSIGDRSHTGAQGTQRPIPKKLLQSQRIIQTLQEMGIDPNAMPPFVPGQRGHKIVVWEKVRQEVAVFVSQEAFNSAWKRMLNSGELKAVAAI